MSGDPAAARWAVIQLVRASGVAGVLAGIAIVLRRLAALAWLPAWVGLVLIAGGLIAVFLVPMLLARKWRSTPQ